MPKNYEPECKARVVRMAIQQISHYPTRTAVREAVVKREGVGRETLRKWVTQHEVDAGAREGVAGVGPGPARGRVFAVADAFGHLFLESGLEDPV